MVFGKKNIIETCLELLETSKLDVTTEIAIEKLNQLQVII